MTDRPDIDLEVLNRDVVVALFPEAVQASQIADGKLVKHKTGLYFQNIPVNPLDGLAAYPYKVAEDLGFYKVDLLECPYPYDGIASMAELRELIATPIDWGWFRHEDFVKTLFHFNNMADTVVRYAPVSIIDIACLVAIKMPAKRYLIGESWDTVRDRIWLKETNGGRQFKKSHSVSYGMVVALDARRKAPGFFNDR